MSAAQQSYERKYRAYLTEHFPHLLDPEGFYLPFIIGQGAGQGPGWSRDLHRRHRHRHGHRHGHGHGHGHGQWHEAKPSEHGTTYGASHPSGYPSQYQGQRSGHASHSTPHYTHYQDQRHAFHTPHGAGHASGSSSHYHGHRPDHSYQSVPRPTGHHRENMNGASHHRALLSEASQGFEGFGLDEPWPAGPRWTPAEKDKFVRLVRRGYHVRSMGATPEALRPVLEDCGYFDREIGMQRGWTWHQVTKRVEQMSRRTYTLSGDGRKHVEIEIIDMDEE